MRPVLAVTFAVLACVIALVRFRQSILYAPYNDVNSDTYTFEMIGNSWLQGFLPYRDVFDVKGPFFFLQFLLFAAVRPWSEGPPTVGLACLAFASVCVCYAIARLRLSHRGVAAGVAISSALLIYLALMNVGPSYTCEETAIPGVLLLLWLVLRWLGGDRVVDLPRRWWILDGVVFAALFWTKYQVIAPWGAIFLAAAVAVLLRRLPVRSLTRVVGWNTVGAVAASIAVLAPYHAVLPDLMRAFFLSKWGTLDDPRTEFSLEAAFLHSLLGPLVVTGLTLLAALGVFFWRAVEGRVDGLVLTLGSVLSIWASAAFIRHDNNLFVPLCFVAAALPDAVLSAGRLRARRSVRAQALRQQALTAYLLVVSVLVCLPPLAQSVERYHLLPPPHVTPCYDLRTRKQIGLFANTSVAFAAIATGPILSPGQLYSARTSYISHRPATLRFQFVEPSWATEIGADRVQARYLADRTFRYVWVHVRGLNRYHHLTEQIAGATYSDGPTQFAQSTAAVRDYLPLVSCNSEVLLQRK